MTTEATSKPQRTLDVTACTAKKQGWTNGRAWTIYAVEATQLDGTPIDEELVSFKQLELKPQLLTVEYRERKFKGRTYSSYMLAPVSMTQPQQHKPKPQVPDGRYAIVGPDGEVGLYRVWVGSRYDPPPIHVYAVKGTEKGVRVSPVTLEIAVLEEIAKDPGAAAIEFGKRTGSCSKCSDKLRKNLSRHMGIGPVCLKHWFEKDARASMLATARKELRDQGIDPEESYDSIGQLGNWSNVA
jgi:hypothetical protein